MLPWTLVAISEKSNQQLKPTAFSNGMYAHALLCLVALGVLMVMVLAINQPPECFIYWIFSVTKLLINLWNFRIFTARVFF